MKSLEVAQSLERSGGCGSEAPEGERSPDGAERRGVGARAGRLTAVFSKCLDLSTSVCLHIFAVSFGRAHELWKKASLEQAFVREI